MPVKQRPASNDNLRVTTLKVSPSRCRYKQVSLYCEIIYIRWTFNFLYFVEI